MGHWLGGLLWHPAGGDEIDETDAHGNEITGDSFLLIFNASGGEVDLVLPPLLPGGAPELVLDTAGAGATPWAPDAPYHALAHSAAVLRIPRM